MQKEEAARKKDQQEWDSKSKIERRVAARQLDPTKWKLRGGAKPAHEVYQEDVRYVDKFKVEMDRHRESVSRQENLLLTKKGRLLEGPAVCREYLDAQISLCKALMECGKVNGAGKLAGRCEELQPGYGFADLCIRCALESNNPAIARKYKSESHWGLYGMALVEFVSWSVLGEEGSTEEVAREALTKAMNKNVLVGFYLAFHDVVDDCLEYKDDVVGKVVGGEGKVRARPLFVWFVCLFACLCCVLRVILVSFYLLL